MAPPAKRRRRNVVESDDEEDLPKTNTLTNFLLSSPSKSDTRGATTSPSPTKPQSRVPEKRRTTAAPAILQSRNGPSNKNTKSPSTSPEKSKGKPTKRVKVEEKGRNGNLMMLFSKQASKSGAKPATSSRTVPLDDIISDPISEDDDVAEQKASTSSIVGQIARKRFRDSTPVSSSSTGLASSQRFLKPPRPNKLAALDDDLRPWSERFGPLNLDELAVHKRKVSDVRKWLEDVLAGRMRQRLLILKGAAGSGKTTTMRLLARDMGYELLEWRNPTGALGAHLGYTSASAQFQEFLGRGGKFGQLDTDLTTEAPRPASTKPDLSGKIILVEEFPNTFSRSSTALTSFRNTLLEYLASNMPSLSNYGRRPANEPITPVVLVISETLLTTTSASADSFTAHRLLGPEILRHPGTRVIEFNAVAPTLLAKALELTVMKEARKSGRKRTPGPQVLKRLGEIGDIRSAISSLEFMCLKGDQDADWGAKIALSKQSKGAKAGISLTKGEEDTLELISQREASLGIFHAVGKVVYNKREEAPSTSNPAERLPSYLAHHSRPKPSEVSVDTLVDETGTDTQTFISALHENYMFSCENVPPFDASTPLDYVNGCIEYLSESDLLLPSWDSFFGGRGTSNFGKDSGSHVLRQDEIAFHVAVRGMLFSLPSPVKRKASTGAKGADAFKMFYPTSLKLWRTKEEFEVLVDVWSTKLMKGEENAPRKSLTEGASAFRRPKQADMGSWMANHQSKPNSAKEISSKTDASAASAPLLSLGSSARREMLLERLPYMASIVRGRKSTLHSFKLKDLEKVVSFQGIGPQTGDDDEAEAEDAQENDGVMPGDAWATDKPSEEASPRKKGSAFRHKGDGSVAGLAVQNLVISDDDIEDD